MAILKQLCSACLAPALAIALQGALYAASFYTETFDDSLGGWQDRDVDLRMTVSYTNNLGNPGGSMLGRFGSQINPRAETDAFIATGSVNTVNFIGDYLAAGIELVGFDFNAVNVIPVSARVELTGRIGEIETDYVARFFHNSLIRTNVWHSFRYRLTSPSDGNWSFGTTNFFKIMTNVVSLQVQISRSGESAQTYLLDNIFIDALPAGGGATAASNTPQIVWNNLRTNEVYRVEASPDLVVPEWTVIATITAQTSTVTTDYPATNDYRFFRMVMP